MGSKQSTLRRIEEGEDTIGRASGGIPDLFAEHYRLALKSMTPEAAAHTAHTAVQNHLASLKETKAGDGMR